VKSLEQLREILQAGQAASMQGSFQRRAPAKQALPALLEARAGLRQLVQLQPEVAEAWRLLSQAEEALLSYTAARESLEQAMKLTAVREKRDLKKLALLKEYEPQWQELSLTPDQLAELGSYLRGQLVSSPCAHDLAWTRRWLEQAGITGATKVLKAFRNQGGFCDCEILANVVAE
jgi:tetratricopeptide (TPR) repeat protein